MTHNNNSGMSQQRHRPRMPAPVQLPLSNAHGMGGRASLPPLHQSPRPLGQQLNFQPASLSVSPPVSSSPPAHGRAYFAPPPPVHQHEHSIFSPRPNGAYTPIAKLDATPQPAPSPAAASAHHHALSFASTIAAQQQQHHTPQPGHRSSHSVSAFGLDGGASAVDLDSAADKALGGSMFALDSASRPAVLNLTNLILGSGIVALPAALAHAGVVAGLCVLALQAWVTSYSLRLLLSSANKLHVLDYEDLLHACFGRKGWLLGLLSILLLDLGAMVMFLIIQADTFMPVLSFYAAGCDETLAAQSIFMNRTFVLCGIGCLVVLPLSALRSLRALSFASTGSVFSVLFIVFLVCSKVLASALGISVDDSPVLAATAAVAGATAAAPTVAVAPAVISAPLTFFGPQFLSAFGSMAFIFVCHDLSFQVYQSIPGGNASKWGRVVRTAVWLSLVPSVLLGLGGYFHFGEGVSSNILNNYPLSSHAVNAARLALGSSLVLTYPLNLFMCRHVLAKMMLGLPGGKHCSTGQHAALTLGLFGVSLLLACSLTDLGLVQGLVGSLAGSMLAFVLPPAAALQVRFLCDGRPYLHRDNAAALALLAFSSLVLFASIFDALF